MFGLFKKKSKETVFEEKICGIFKSYCGADIFRELPSQEKRSIMLVSLGVLIEIHGESALDSDDPPVDDLVTIVFLNFASHLWQKESVMQHHMVTMGLMQFMTDTGMGKISAPVLQEAMGYLAANRI